MPFEASAAVKRGSTHYFRAALGKPLFQGLATFCAMLYDMAEVDDLIYELSDVQGTYAENAAEKLMQTCSRSSEAFQYLQDRVCDVAIPERARNHIHLIIAKIRMWMSLHHAYGWTESNYAYSFGSSS